MLNVSIQFRSLYYQHGLNNEYFLSARNRSWCKRTVLRTMVVLVTSSTTAARLPVFPYLSLAVPKGASGLVAFKSVSQPRLCCSPSPGGDRVSKTPPLPGLPQQRRTRTALLRVLQRHYSFVHFHTTIRPQPCQRQWVSHARVAEKKFLEPRSRLERCCGASVR